MRRYVVFVDCQMASNAMAYIARNMGLVPVHVYSSYERYQNNIRSLIPSVYEHHFIHHDISSTYSALSRLPGRIVAVIPGADSALPLCISLSEELLRFRPRIPLDRYIIALLLGEWVSLDPQTDAHFLSLKVDEYVIKPRVSEGGIDRVSIVPADPVPDISNEMFASPFYKGKEYSVDMVSYAGRHRLTAVWRYTKYPNEPLKRKRTDLVHPSEEAGLVHLVASAVSNWLSGLQSDYTGASHTEVIVDDTGHVNLVEINYRTQGQMSMRALTRALKYNQPTETVRAHVGERIEYSVLDYETQAHVARYNLFNKYERKFTDVRWSDIEALPTFAGFFHHFTPFDDLPVSDHTLRSMTSKVLFASDDREQIERDIRRAQELFDERI